MLKFFKQYIRYESIISEFLIISSSHYFNILAFYKILLIHLYLDLVCKYTHKPYIIKLTPDQMFRNKFDISRPLD